MVRDVSSMDKNPSSLDLKIYFLHVLLLVSASYVSIRSFRTS
jgi:hypothetical protein